jgi:phosphoribosylaminoimidazole-succinocarboxamide synthase
LEGSEKISSHYLGQDSDGCWFIKPFSGFLGGRLPREMQNDDSFRDKVVEQFERTREHIQKELARAKDKGPDRLAKYRWLANQFNAAVKEIFQGMNISVDPIEVSCRP